MDPPLKGGVFTYNEGLSKPHLGHFRRNNFLCIQTIISKAHLRLSPVPLFSFCWGLVLKVVGFGDFDKIWWWSYEFRGNPNFIPVKKLKNMKEHVKK